MSRKKEWMEVGQALWLGLSIAGAILGLVAFIVCLAHHQTWQTGIAAAVMLGSCVSVRLAQRMKIPEK